MSTNFIATASIIGVVGTLGAGCTSDPVDPGDIPPGAQVGRLYLELGSAEPQDLDPRVEGVWLRIESVQVRHEDRDWVNIGGERLDVDLMGDVTQIGEADVWVGTYDRTEIAIADAWIIVDGVEQELRFGGNFDPLDPLAGSLVVNDTFFVDEDSETTVRIALDLDENLTPDGDGWRLGSATSTDVDIVASE